MKFGNWKMIVASDSESVEEVLVKRSADYLGRPQTSGSMALTLGKLLYPPNN